MKHFAPFLLSLLLAALLCGCELVKDDPIPPPPTEVTVPAKAEQTAMPMEEFPQWMEQYVDMSLYAQAPETADAVTFTLRQTRQYPLDYTVTAGGQTFALPLSYDGMVAAGWDIELGKADVEIAANYTNEATWRRDDNLRMILRAGNPFQTAMTYRQLPLYRIKLVFRSVQDGYAALLPSAPTVTFSGLDESATLAQVIDTFGAPTELTYGLAKNNRTSWLELQFTNTKRDFLNLRFSGDGQWLCQLEYSKNPA